MIGPEKKITTREPTDTKLKAPNTPGLAMITPTVKSAHRVESAPHTAAGGIPPTRSTALGAGVLLRSGPRDGSASAATEPAGRTRAKNSATLAGEIAMVRIATPHARK